LISERSGVLILDATSFEILFLLRHLFNEALNFARCTPPKATH